MATTVVQKDTTFTKIFVGGLPYHTTDQSLREFFEQFGDIEEAVVITDRQTGKSRGYGFVTMADRAAAERACKDPNPVIDGRKANVNLAYLGAKPRGIQAALPFVAMKAGYPSLVPGQIGLPQLVYPSTYVTTSQGVLPVAPHSPLSPTANTNYMDYQAAMYGQLSNVYEASYPGTAAAATAGAYVAPTYSAYAAVPQQIATAGHIAHFQPAQIQERMQ